MQIANSFSGWLCWYKGDTAETVFLLRKVMTISVCCYENVSRFNIQIPIGENFDYWWMGKMNKHVIQENLSFWYVLNLQLFFVSWKLNCELLKLIRRIGTNCIFFKAVVFELQFLKFGDHNFFRNCQAGPNFFEKWEILIRNFIHFFCSMKVGILLLRINRGEFLEQQLILKIFWKD